MDGGLGEAMQHDLLHGEHRRETKRRHAGAADALETAGVEAEVIDLRSISPWDEQAVIASAEKTSRLIVVHEDNQTCGFGAEILSTVAEKACVPVALRRVTRPDTHVPFNFANQMDLLPSVPRVLAVAADLTNLDLAWKSEPEPEERARRLQDRPGPGEDVPVRRGPTGRGPDAAAITPRCARSDRSRRGPTRSRGRTRRLRKR